MRLLDHGVATSHDQMPQRLRRLMTYLIDRRICPVTLATVTLTEGVNLPFDIIFASNGAASMRKHSSRQSCLSTTEFRNLAGRAGRPGAAESIEGMTLVAVPESPSTTAAGQRNKQLNQIRRAAQDYNNLLGRLQVEDAGGIVYSPLVVLLRSIWVKAAAQFGLQTQEQFLA